MTADKFIKDHETFTEVSHGSKKNRDRLKNI